ncbi:MAG: protein kinase, partial [Candidatus Acidiferrales bacterium]
MTITTGTRIGCYEVQAPLGAGGMGEVYRATQTSLGRQVAVKILSAAVACDPERIRRFEQEARAASALNHPNIISIYDVGRDGAICYIAMEYVDGKTLRAVLNEGPAGIKKTLQIAAQVADGLAKAHAAGIVHRDLKPENVMVSREGLVKILDFGLAKLGMPGDGATQTNLGSAAGPVTDPGTVMGTVGYMSPEQARGEAVDFRSDIFSFGSMLYEMVTGTRPFRAASTAQTLAAIIEDDPKPVAELNPKTPAPLRWIIERCLAKDPEERYASTRDLASDLRGVRDHLSDTGTSAAALAAEAGVTAGPLRRKWLKPVVWLATGAVAGALLGVFLAPRTEVRPPTFRNITFSGTDTAPSVSPDGRVVAFVSQRDGKSRIWLKQIESGSETALTQGPNDATPRFSPDGGWILYVGGNVLYRIPSLGGEPRKILENVTSADWMPDGREVVFLRSEFTTQTTTTLVGIASPQDGTSRIIHRYENEPLGPPSVSPDGNLIALSVLGLGSVGPVTGRYVHLLSRTGEDRKLMCPLPGGALSMPSWSGTGEEVIYSEPESAAEVSVQTVTSVGSPGHVMAQNIRTGKIRQLFTVQAPLSRVEIAPGGRVIFDAKAQRNNLKEVSIAGSSGGTPDRWLTRGSSIDRQPDYSPDGESVIFSSSRSGDVDIWEVSTKTDALRRLTDHPAADWDPFVTRDGKSLVWSSDRTGVFEIWMADRDGSSPHQVSHDGYDAENPVMTSDGWIIYASSNPQHPGLWKIRPDGTQATILVTGLASWPDASPDGQFVLYHLLTGQLRARVMVVRVADGKRVDFEADGTRARFTNDGKAIVYIRGATGEIVSQPFPSSAGAAAKVLVEKPSEFFSETFDVSPDGKHVVVSYPEMLRSLMMAEG